MLNTYSPWDELAARAEIELCWREMHDRVGQYEHGLRRITLDPRMPKRQRRSVLCHELRHAEAGDTHTVCDRANLRQEQAADRRAAFMMIDARDLARALVLHDCHHSAVAVELHVSDHLLDVRLSHLHPVESHWISGQLQGLG
jgi:Zn-dependent peptidase ImmA (M78 family)